LSFCPAHKFHLRYNVGYHTCFLDNEGY